jgi:two-component sensor histidine kinase
VDDAELLGTELVTNALRHGTGPIAIEVDRVDGTVRIAVLDRGGGRPRPRTADFTEESGRGLVLIQALSEQWGVTELDRGKSVWVTLPMLLTAGSEGPVQRAS